MNTIYELHLTIEGEEQEMSREKGLEALEHLFQLVNFAKTFGKAHVTHINFDIKANWIPL